MIIEGRKKKEYSEKLFGELCLLYLLMESNNNAYLYILNNKLKKSSRTIYRYADDLYVNGITPKISTHKKKNKKYNYLFCKSIIKKNDKDYYFALAYIKEFIIKNKSVVFKNKQHKDKLFRTALLMIENIDNYYDIDFFDDVQDSYDHPKKVNGNTFAFECFDVLDEIYKDVSLKTKQREIKIVKDVIYHMFED